MGDVTPIVPPPPPAWWSTVLKSVMFRRIASFLVGIALTAACGALPAQAQPICRTVVGGVQRIVAGATEAVSSSSSPASSPAPAPDARPQCPEDLCLSNGYALPMPDGGSCRCIPVRR